MTSLVAAFKTNPTFLTQYHSGMNILGLRSQTTIGNYLKTGIFELAPDMQKLSDDMKKIVEEARGK